ncbi:MAG: CBS domain-containing protein [Hyphomicrobiaceae bacterium]|nr:CBS domain-containing protein [Hyphomicrobiaceae bacterium]
MKVGDYVNQLSQSIVSCRAEDTATTAATLLTTNRIGAMPVCDPERGLIGILSERDLVRAMTGAAGPVSELRVKDLMTSAVITCSPSDSMLGVCKTMINRKIRHVPVVDGNKVRGMVSIRDALAHRLEELELESGVLRDSVIAARHR